MPKSSHKRVRNMLNLPLLPAGEAYTGAISNASRERRMAVPVPALIVAPALVEEFGIAAIVVTADDGAVPNLRETVLLEDALHPVVVCQGGTADDLQVKLLEGVGDQQAHCLGRVTPAAQAPGSDLYAELASLVPEVVHGHHADRFGGFPSLHDEGLDARVLPAGEVVAARGGERDGDRGPSVPGCQLGIPIPGVDRKSVV